MNNTDQQRLRLDADLSEYLEDCEGLYDDVFIRPLAAYLIDRGWRLAEPVAGKETEAKAAPKPTTNSFNFQGANFSGSNNVIGRLD
jgi:hypothetical protein